MISFVISTRGIGGNMITVLDLLSHTVFKNFTLLNSRKGLMNRVNHPGAFEWETEQEIPWSFTEHEFVTTVLTPYKDDLSRGFELLKKVVDCNVAAIAIKSVFVKEVPQDFLDYADEKGVPIFLFHDTFLENIMYAIQSVVTPEEINMTAVSHMKNLLNERLTADEKRYEAHQINQYFADKNICAVFIPRNMESTIRCMQEYAEEYRSLSNTIKLPPEYTYSVLRRPESIILILSAYLSSDEAYKYLDDVIDFLKLDSERFVCGISNITDDLADLGTALKEATYAVVDASINSKERRHFNDIGFMQVLCPLRDNSWVKRYSEAPVKQLEKIMEGKEKILAETAKVFVDNDFDYARTAEKLFTHQNTVRYRIKKLLEIMKIEDSPYAYTKLATFIRLMEINYYMNKFMFF